MGRGGREEEEGERKGGYLKGHGGRHVDWPGQESLVRGEQDD